MRIVRIKIGDRVGKRLSNLGRNIRGKRIKKKHYTKKLDKINCGYCNKKFQPKHFNQKYCCKKCRFREANNRAILREEKNGRVKQQA